MLMVNEIFRSIQGESTYVGLPCTFVRLAGCNLRCPYCDTVYAQEKDAGTEMAIEDILDRAGALKCSLVEVTGGEPLLQDETKALLTQLIYKGYTVLLETNGSVLVNGVEPQVHVIMDLKCPSSQHVAQMKWENLLWMSTRDEIKFVIADAEDYDWARKLIINQLRDFQGTILMSPVFGRMEPKQLAEWILRDELDVRMQIQLHKVIWPPDQRGV